MMLNREFQSRIDLIQQVTSHYKEAGVLLKVGRHSDQRRVMLQCLSGDNYSERRQKKEYTRSTSSRLSGCPFVVKALFSKKRNTWQVTEILEEHNHDMAPGYYENRRMGDEEKAIVRQMLQHGADYASVSRALQADFNNQHNTTKRVLYNEAAAMRAEFLDGRPPIVALIDELTAADYICHVRKNADGAVSGLFYTHKESVKLAKRFCSVFVMDCTYKTNRFGMPLLNIVGITSTFSTFNAGFAFLRMETCEEYTWALEAFSSIVRPKLIATDRELALMNAISIVFPSARHILCMWHINKNVLAHTKRFFPVQEDFDSFMEHWTGCVYSNSEEDFKAQWHLMTTLSGSSGWQSAVSYVQDTWIPFSERFVKCYVDQFLHLGSASTSRGEGNHG
jgi:hypothetical protein